MTAPVPNKRNLEQDLNALGNSLTPARPLAPTIVAQLQPLSHNPHYSFKRKWIMRTTVGIAATFLLTGILASLFLQPAVAFAQVLKNIEQSRSLTCDFEANERAHIVINGDLMRVELPDNVVTIGNRVTGEWVTLNPNLKTATKLNMARQPFDLYVWFKNFKDGKEEERLGEKTINNRKVIGFKASRPSPDGAPDSAPATLTFWVDNTTNLPVEIEGKMDNHDLHVTNITWNQQLDEKLFAMTIPEGYAIEQMGIAADKLKAPPTTLEALSLTLKPGVGIGDLKFGDTPERITEVLGKPDAVTAKNTSWEYPSKGLSIAVFPRTGLTLVTAMSKKAFPLNNVNDFPGKTDKGLAIGSTREQVEAIYGKPTKTDAAETNRATLYYDSNYVWFTIQDGHVIQINLQPTHETLQALRNATTRAAQPALP